MDKYIIYLNSDKIVVMNIYLLLSAEGGEPPVAK